jgi:hypothetical protein
MYHMWWWLIPLVFFLMMRGSRRRYYRERGWGGGEQVAELRRTVESQRDYIDQLETRLARVEEGLEFAERLLSERAGASAH